MILSTDSPNQEVDQVVWDIKTELSRTQKTIDQEFDKAKDSYNDLSEKVNDIGDLLISTKDRLDTFDKALAEIREYILNK